MSQYDVRISKKFTKYSNVNAQNVKKNTKRNDWSLSPSDSVHREMVKQ